MHSGLSCPHAQSRGCLEKQRPPNSVCPQDIQYFRDPFCILLWKLFHRAYGYFPFYLFPLSVSVPSWTEHRNPEHQNLASIIWHHSLPHHHIHPTKKGAHSHQGGLSERWRKGKEDDDRIRWDIKGSPGIWLPIIESNKASRKIKNKHRSVMFRQTQRNCS